MSRLATSSWTEFKWSDFLMIRHTKGFKKNLPQTAPGRLSHKLSIQSPPLRKNTFHTIHSFPLYLALTCFPHYFCSSLELMIIVLLSSLSSSLSISSPPLSVLPPLFCSFAHQLPPPWSTQPIYLCVSLHFHIAIPFLSLSLSSFLSNQTLPSAGHKTYHPKKNRDLSFVSFFAFFSLRLFTRDKTPHIETHD